MTNNSTPAFFSNTTLVPCRAGHAPTLRTFGVVDHARKKRPHTKSRRGCLACKGRRVKCDERLPCTSCVKRNIQCQQPAQYNLFHHWDKETRFTLAFPQVWPTVMQRAFDEDFIMSAILCVSSMHLASLFPQSAKYSNASMRFMGSTIQLFRKCLAARPLTKDICESLMGTALLINYISWFDLGFLETAESTGYATRLNLVNDQLFFLSPSIVNIWFHAMPIFIDEESVFTQMIFQNPRGNIEQFLARRGEDPARFVEPFMKIWDDSRHQISNRMSNERTTSSSMSYAPRLLFGLEAELSCHGRTSRAPKSPSEEDTKGQKLTHLRDAVTRVTSGCATIRSSGTSASLLLQSPRLLFERIIRRISPLLFCASLKSNPHALALVDITPLETDIEQLFYGFPILCCGPFAEMIVQGDSRALVFLFHFYHAARILLSSKRCWWASNRSRVMEKLIFEELKSREVDVCLRTQHCEFMDVETTCP